MPSYDVECAQCGHNDIMQLSIMTVDAWDAAAHCPKCSAASYRRVMRKAPAGCGGSKAQAKSDLAKKSDQKSHFVTSGAKDAMRHREFKTRDKDQVKQAVENVRRGAFEGF